LIQTPTANSKEEGTISFTFNRNDIWKFGTLSVAPFDWLEASYFYYRPSDLIWSDGDGIAGHDLDKGFNVKFKYSPKNKNFPNVAIGLDDFAGTGYFTKEYIVATQELFNMKVSLGIGWGNFVGEKSLSNPLAYLSKGFENRPGASSNFNKGGSLSYDKWFRGDTTLFGGLEYFLPFKEELSLKLEYDPLNYNDFSARNRNDASFDLRRKDSNINFGINYSLNNLLDIEASYIKGNTFNLSFTVKTTFNEKLRNKPKFNPVIQVQDDLDNSNNSFYEDLLYNLNNNNLFLQTASLADNKLDISISTSQYRNSIRSSSYAASIAKKVSDIYSADTTKISVSQVNAGIEINSIEYITNYINNSDIPVELVVRNTSLDSGNPSDFLNNEFRPRVIYPVIFSSTKPVLVSHIGNPEKFFFGGIDIQNISEIQFRRNLLLSTELNARVFDDFRNTISGPGSKMEHVRTDVVQYLKEDDIYITRFQLDYIWSPRKEVYAKLSGGIYETMFAGFGVEALYRPFNKNYNLGFELFKVRQRDYDQRFNFKNYETVTGHINLGYRFPYGIESNISLGRYLAKDDGYTFDLSRTTKSGFKAGVYFTRTNVSADLFGEGSFDKGFYFQIPLDLFMSNYNGNYSSFKLSPLTRDGGARLMHDKDLRGLIYNSSYYDLSQQWDGYMN
jgi:hypothetical protein